ncbi:MAG: hypothetical protein ACKE9I_05080 [Methylophagaceae bacterium]
MKQLVNLIQLIVVVGLVYPVFHMWDADKVEQFCKIIEPSMEKEYFLELADEANVKMIGPTDYTIIGGKWQATVIGRSAFSTESCLIKGTANKIAIVQMVDNNEL